MEIKGKNLPPTQLFSTEISNSSLTQLRAHEPGKMSWGQEMTNIHFDFFFIGFSFNAPKKDLNPWDWWFCPWCRLDIALLCKHVCPAVRGLEDRAWCQAAKRSPGKERFVKYISFAWLGWPVKFRAQPFQVDKKLSYLLFGVPGLLLNLSLPGRSKVPFSSLSVVSGLRRNISHLIIQDCKCQLLSCIESRDPCSWYCWEDYLPSSSSFNSFSLSVSIVELTLTSEPGSSLKDGDQWQFKAYKHSKGSMHEREGQKVAITC